MATPSCYRRGRRQQRRSSASIRRFGSFASASRPPCPARRGPGRRRRPACAAGCSTSPRPPPARPSGDLRSAGVDQGRGGVGTEGEAGGGLCVPHTCELRPAAAAAGGSEMSRGARRIPIFFCAVGAPPCCCCCCCAAADRERRLLLLRRYREGTGKVQGRYRESGGSCCSPSSRAPSAHRPDTCQAIRTSKSARRRDVRAAGVLGGSARRQTSRLTASKRLMNFSSVSKSWCGSLASSSPSRAHAPRNSATAVRWSESKFSFRSDAQL